MEPITQEDLNLIIRCSGQEVNHDNFHSLKVVYSKLKHLCQLLEKRGFTFEIRLDPRKQAGPGRFVFQNYHWARIYPTEYSTFAKDKFAYIIGLSDSFHFHLMGIKGNKDNPASLKASKVCWTELELKDITYSQIVDNFIDFDKKYRKLFLQTGADLGIKEFIIKINQMKKEEVIDLLKYKKQIILQGPPGTGKTRLAKEIAQQLTRPKTINITDIKNHIKVGITIYSKYDNIPYYVEAVNSNGITLKLENGNTQAPNYDSIIQAYSNYLNNLPLIGGDAYQAAIAKYIYDNWIFNDTYLKLIQFHPSYSYEDFVRGITAKPNDDGDGLFYEPENKLIAKFAKEALVNFQTNEKNGLDKKLLNETRARLDKFVAFVQDQLDSSDTRKYFLTDKVYIFEVNGRGFKYKGDKWEAHAKGLNLKFTELEKLINANVKERSEVKEIQDIEMLTKSHATYFFKAVEKFHEFDKKIPEVADPSSFKASNEINNFVLIIDEINRANLSSVLGELVYGLEYRGEMVESMYEVDGSNHLTLPPNLFIIGTMNTADRSVGHIDYAIRRRFAFVDVLPEILPGNFETNLFLEVSKLFVNDINSTDLTRSIHLSEEFNPKDVWLGHSYFIKKEGVNSNVRLKYEIVPILEEYIKDGVLKDSEDVRKILQGLKSIIK